MNVVIGALSLTCRAIKNGKGLHSKKEVPIHRVADISGVRIFFSPPPPFLTKLDSLRNFSSS